MNKNDFANELSLRCGIAPWAIKITTTAISDYICDKLCNGDEVNIPELGTFSLAKRKSSVGKNLLGGIEKEIPPLSYPVFKFANKIKRSVKIISKDS